jgi:protoheme IX farnesyltransferase
MLPVVATPVAVARQVVAYSWVMVGVSLVLWPVAGTTPVYPVAATLLGAAFLREAHVLLHRARTGAAVEASAMRVFHGSITYLTLLFLAVAVDPLLPL